MQEYNDAKRKLLEAYRIAKKELADKVRPTFFVQFSDFFKNYPEIGSISFRLSTSIYDDENYESGVEAITFKLAKDYTTPRFRDLEGDYWHEDLAWTMRDTRREDGAGASLLTTFESADRISIVANAVEALCDTIADMDIEFLQDTFENNCSVIVTPNGFEVEK